MTTVMHLTQIPFEDFHLSNELLSRCCFCCRSWLHISLISMPLTSISLDSHTLKHCLNFSVIRTLLYCSKNWWRVSEAWSVVMNILFIAIFGLYHTFEGCSLNLKHLSIECLKTYFGNISFLRVGLVSVWSLIISWTADYIT